ncbi:MAG: hypothetical protein M3Z07_04715 [Candidatus Eremiobacteraeota bacterium]|nr:hypothetical protein [Candidatus Eremiobacteraeota bacterium]
MFVLRPVYLRALVCVASLSVAAVAPAALASPAPAIAAFDAAFASVHDYSVTVTAHEVSGSNVQDRVYHYWFMRPSLAKIEIVSGAGTGSGGVWAGGDRVSGHQGGFLSRFHLKVGLHDGRATSLRGYTIPDGLIQNVVDKFRQLKGALSQSGGPVVAGQSTDMVELQLANPSAFDGVTRMDIYFSKSTHMPLRQARYSGNQVVAQETFTELKVNTGLTQRDFPY